MESEQGPPDGESKSFTLECQTGSYSVTGQRIAAVADSPSRVEMNDFSGLAVSWNDREHGGIGVSIRDAPHRGRDNEPSVLDVLRQVLGQIVEPGEDARGEDGRVRGADCSVLTVQIVTVPPDELVNREIGRGAMERYLTYRDAAGWLHSSIERKLTIPASLRPKTILVLDARHLAMFASEPVLAEFQAAYPDPAKYGFAQIWLIGPVPDRSARLA